MPPRSVIDPLSPNNVLQKEQPGLLDFLLGALEASPGSPEWGGPTFARIGRQAQARHQENFLRRLAEIAQSGIESPGQEIPAGLTDPVERGAFMRGLMGQQEMEQKSASTELARAKLMAILDQMQNAPTRRERENLGETRQWGTQWGSGVMPGVAGRLGIESPVVPDTPGMGQARQQRMEKEPREPKAPKMPEKVKTQYSIYRKLLWEYYKAKRDEKGNIDADDPFTYDKAIALNGLYHYLQTEGQNEPYPVGLEKLLPKAEPLAEPLAEPSTEADKPLWRRLQEMIPGSQFGPEQSRQGTETSEPGMSGETTKVSPPGTDEELWVDPKDNEPYYVKKGTKPPKGWKKVKKFAGGGVVTKPTVAMLGERGPEAVIPLSRRSANFSAAESQRIPPSLQPEKPSWMMTMTDTAQPMLAQLFPNHPGRDFSRGQRTRVGYSPGQGPLLLDRSMTDPREVGYAAPTRPLPNNTNPNAQREFLDRINPPRIAPQPAPRQGHSPLDGLGIDSSTILDILRAIGY